MFALTWMAIQMSPEGRGNKRKRLFIIYSALCRADIDKADISIPILRTVFSAVKQGNFQAFPPRKYPHKMSQAPLLQFLA
jgi:hypothetical protein